MLKKSERIQTLSQLGDWVSQNPNKDTVFEKARQSNPFFIPQFIQSALDSILSWHQSEILEPWLSEFHEDTQAQNIGLVLAGNIPFVGWHDLVSVFSSGHFSKYKPSAQDQVLIDWLVGGLMEINPGAIPYFQKVENLKNVDALIATGSNNTVAHFNYYFRHIPRLVRGSKSSLAILYGFENEEELVPLCDDIMLYFGLGCRNVTKLLVPLDYDFDLLFRAMEKYRFFTDHNKFQNNAIYHKSIFLMNGSPFLDNDILMLREDPSLFSPLSVVNYETYESLEEAQKLIAGHQSDLQCLLSFQGKWENSIPFGTSQKPKIDDFADGVNTLNFLNALS